MPLREEVGDCVTACFARATREDDAHDEGLYLSCCVAVCKVNDEEVIGDLGPGRFVTQNVILSLLLTMLTQQALLVLALTLAATARYDPWTTRYGSTPDLSFSGITTFAHLPHVKCLDSPDKGTSSISFPTTLVETPARPARPRSSQVL